MPHSRRSTENPSLDDESHLVWHYTNGPGLISILTHHVLWATSANFLNDQQEVALGADLIGQRVIELAHGHGDDVVEEVSAKIADGIRSSGGPSAASFHILSASQTWDSLVMWRNYGGRQESYAIGLDARAPLKVLTDHPEFDPASYGSMPGAVVNVRPTQWEPVRYSAAEQGGLVDAVFDELPQEIRRFRDHLADLEPSSVLAGLPEAVTEGFAEVWSDLEHALLLIKHSGFVDEREIRKSVVLYTDPSNPEAETLAARLTRYRSTQYGMAPYIELTGSDPDDDHGPVTSVRRPLPIRAVAISPSPNGVEAAESLHGLLASRGYRDVPVLRSAIPFRG